MSGGIAYVLDEEGNFETRCNLAMVELESVAEEEELNQRLHHQGGDLQIHGRVDVMSDMTRFDAERLHQLISNHARYTGSTRAKEILDNWDVLQGQVPQGDAGRIPARPERDVAAAARRLLRGSDRWAR